MARAVRPVKAKRKKIRIYKQGEQVGDIHISGREARIRITPKIVLLFCLMVTAAVAIVIVAARQGRQQSLAVLQAPKLPVSTAATISPATQAAEGAGPVIATVELSPQQATAGTLLELKYAMSSAGSGEVLYSVRWLVNEGPVQEGPAMTLQPGAFQKGSRVSAELTVTDGAGRSATLATPPLTVANTPPQVTGVVIEPKLPQRGKDLAVSAAALDADNDTLTCQYQWQVNGAPVGPAGSQNTFSTANLRKQDVVTVSAVCTDGQDATPPVVSTPVSFGNSDPEILSTPPDSVVSGVYTYQLNARDPDGDTLQYRLDRMPAGMTIDQNIGFLQWNVPKGVLYTGRNEIQVKVSVEDGNGGSASQEFSIVLVDYVIY